MSTQFSLYAGSWHGRDDADVEIILSSERPEKRLAELLVLELAIQQAIGRQRAALQRLLRPSNG